MKTVPTWRVILGSVVLTCGIVASYSLRHEAVETAEAAPARGDAGVGSAHGDAGMHPGGGVRSDAGAGSAEGSAAGSATHKAKRHSTPATPPTDNPRPPTDNPGPPHDDIPPVPPISHPVPPGSPGPTGPIVPGTTPTNPPTTPTTKDGTPGPQPTPGTNPDTP